MFFCDDNADWLREHAGSWWSVWLHTVSFLLSFNLGLDINLLTVIVSLEAVFLCIFLLMSCNRQGEVTGTRLRRTTVLTNLEAKANVEGPGAPCRGPTVPRTRRRALDNSGWP
jgi:hypothetical protein